MRILLGVTGSIAAYKSLQLCRLFIKHGHEVCVVMTPAAEKFVSKLSFSTLSKKEVYSGIIENDSWANHVELGLWADLMIIAPATANTIAKLANGIADNMVIACYLSARCPVYIAPAMDVDMWKHPSTSMNITRLKSYGNIIIPVEHGELASGLHGDGRMAEPENIYRLITTPDDVYVKQKILQGKKVLITLGPTVEAIDPVRYISNHSTGLMGIRLIEECLKSGAASVIAVSGPTKFSIPQDQRVEVHLVSSAKEMYESCERVFDDMDVVIFAAAVADYTPAKVSAHKVKKNDEELSIQLVKTIDIAATLGVKKKNQLTIGFALETQNESQNAIDKLNKKNFDFIVLNSLNDPGAGFAKPTNRITIHDKVGRVKTFDTKDKAEVAKDIIEYIAIML